MSENAPTKPTAEHANDASQMINIKIQTHRLTPVRWRRKQLTPSKGEVEFDHTPADKSYNDHLIKMYSLDKHPREY